MTSGLYNFTELKVKQWIKKEIEPIFLNEGTVFTKTNTIERCYIPEMAIFSTPNEKLKAYKFLFP